MPKKKKVSPKKSKKKVSPSKTKKITQVKPKKKKVSPKKSKKKVSSSKTKKSKTRRLLKSRRGRPRLTQKKTQDQPEKKNKKKYQPEILRGMKDVLPEETKIWNYVLRRARDLAKEYSFEEIFSPILEEQALFEKATGLTSDIVEKQMYQFTDRGGNKIVLRPELTPSIVRAYIEQGMFNLSQPVKIFYFGPAFRYERPQAGRMRQFYQFGLETVGSANPSVDAQLILFAQVLFNLLNLKVNIQVNSLGCPVCRQPYRNKLVRYLKSHQKSLCPDCQKRLKRNPLRILDCKNEKCQEIIQQAPQLVDDICPDCRQHFVKVLEYLDETNVVYKVNPYLVRGLDYYTRTVFEFLPNREGIKKEIITSPQVEEEKKEPVKKEEREIKEEKLGAQSALGGGGRYDNLVENLGGRPTPAAGFACGFERIIEELKIQRVSVPHSRPPQVFLAQIGEIASRQALRLFEELRQQGIRVKENVNKTSLKAQMEMANKLGVKMTLILGHQEVLDQTIIIRNMHTGNQEIVDQEKIIKELKKRL